MDLSNLRPAEGSKHNSFRRGRGHGSGNGKRDIRDRKHAQAAQDPVLKAVRCLYTDVSLREVLKTATQRI